MHSDGMPPPVMHSLINLNISNDHNKGTSPHYHHHHPTNQWESISSNVTIPQTQCSSFVQFEQLHQPSKFLSGSIPNIQYYGAQASTKIEANNNNYNNNQQEQLNRLSSLSLSDNYHYPRNYHQHLCHVRQEYKSSLQSSNKDDYPKIRTAMSNIYGTPDHGSIYRRQQYRQQQPLIMSNNNNNQQYSNNQALISYNQRQRRWSDGIQSKYFKPEFQDYEYFISETDQASNMIKQQQNLARATATSLYLQALSTNTSSSDKKTQYIPNCTCNRCVRHTNIHKLSRPKVSFGPSTMMQTMMLDEPPITTTTTNSDHIMFNNNKNNYPDDPFKQTIQPNANDIKKPAPSWSKLTTELLPLDTQIPLQMMSDSALVCNIL